MTSIQERGGADGSKHYRVQIRLKGHPTVSETFERKSDAKRWTQDTESATRNGRHFQANEAKRHTVIWRRLGI
jgi:hypothetical protein